MRARSRRVVLAATGLVALGVCAAFAQPPRSTSSGQAAGQVRAQARAGTRARVPMPMLQGARDAELTRLVRDILVLRVINSLGMTRQQMAALIPLLENVVAADRRLRDEARKQLLAERQRLIAGTATPQQSRQAMAAIAAARRRYAQELADIRDQTGQVLSPQQVQKLNRLASGAAPGPAKPPGVRKSPETQSLRPGGSPSAEALERIIVLLKEKLQAMPGV